MARETLYWSQNLGQWLSLTHSTPHFFLVEKLFSSVNTHHLSQSLLNPLLSVLPYPSLCDNKSRIFCLTYHWLLVASDTAVLSPSLAVTTLLALFESWFWMLFLGLLCRLLLYTVIYFFGALRPSSHFTSSLYMFSFTSNLVYPIAFLMFLLRDLKII